MKTGEIQVLINGELRLIKVESDLLIIELAQLLGGTLMFNFKGGFFALKK